MRSLQRLRHQRPLAPREVSLVERRESQTIARRKADRRRKRGWRAFALGLIVACGVLILQLATSGRVVVEGLVRAETAVVRAPARVRVARVATAPGERCEVGDVLLELEAVEAHAERRVLELEVARAEQRLQLVAAGGDLGTSDLNRRRELVSDAEVQRETAEARAEQASAEWQALLRARELAAVELRRDRLEAAQEIVRLTARLEALGAQSEQVGAERVLAELEAEQREDLFADGLVSEHERVASEVTRRIARQEWQGATTALASAEAELQHATSLVALEDERGAAVLEELEARIEAAQRTLELELARCTLWEAVAQERGALLPPVPVEGDALRELELGLLQVELESARASLEAFDARIGNTAVVAELSGVVDVVLVREGSVVEAGEVLVRCVDPSTLRIDGYAGGRSAADLTPGLSCSVVTAGDHTLAGAVASVATAWEPCPEALLDDGRAEASPRLPFRVLPSEPAALARLRPGARVRLVLSR